MFEPVSARSSVIPALPILLNKNLCSKHFYALVRFSKQFGALCMPVVLLALINFVLKAPPNRHIRVFHSHAADARIHRRASDSKLLGYLKNRNAIDYPQPTPIVRLGLGSGKRRRVSLCDNIIEY
jgi:hypothetical protein